MALQSFSKHSKGFMQIFMPLQRCLGFVEIFRNFQEFSGLFKTFWTVLQGLLYFFGILRCFKGFAGFYKKIQVLFGIFTNFQSFLKIF